MNTAIAQGKTHVYRDLLPHLITALLTIGKITGEINEFAAASVSITNNNFSVMNSPVVAEFQSEIIDASRPIPRRGRLFFPSLSGTMEPQMKLIELAEAPRVSIYVRFADAMRNDWGAGYVQTARAGR